MNPLRRRAEYKVWEKVATEFEKTPSYNHNTLFYAKLRKFLGDTWGEWGKPLLSDVIPKYSTLRLFIQIPYDGAVEAKVFREELSFEEWQKIKSLMEAPVKNTLKRQEVINLRAKEAIKIVAEVFNRAFLKSEVMGLSEVGVEGRKAPTLTVPLQVCQTKNDAILAINPAYKMTHKRVALYIEEISKVVDPKGLDKSLLHKVYELAELFKPVVDQDKIAEEVLEEAISRL